MGGARFQRAVIPELGLVVIAELAPGKAADVLILKGDSLELRDVIAGGKRVFRDSRLDFKESYLEKSNRVVNLVGEAE